MHPVPTTAVLAALQWRYATKKFDPAKKVPADTWAVLEQALVLAPSSFGLQPWKFIVVQDPALRQRLSTASFGQIQPVDCSHFVVFAQRKNLSAADVDRYIDRVVEVRGGTKEALKAYRDIMVGATDKARVEGYLETWISHQVYIALGQFMAAAALCAVDTCPMEGLDQAKYDEILGLPALGYTTLCACAAGYRAEHDKYARAPKVRFHPHHVITTM
jgi:nitroreductase